MEITNGNHMNHKGKLQLQITSVNYKCKLQVDFTSVNYRCKLFMNKFPGFLKIHLILQ